MRVIGRRLSQTLVLGGTDRVVAGYPLAASGSLNNVWLDVSCIGSGSLSILMAAYYGLTGFVVPLLDPDNVATYDAIWDTQIPKDVAEAAGVFDLDTGASDTTPEFEVGEADWSSVFQLASGAPMEIYRRRELVTFPKMPVGYVDIATDEYRMVARFKAKIGRKVNVETPSVALFGFSNPDMLTTTATPWDTLSEVAWVQYQYLELTLEQAWMHLVGLTEAGSETPYEEAAALVAELIEDTVFEETGGSFAAVNWTVFCEATFDVSVPGRYVPGVITSE